MTVYKCDRCGAQFNHPDDAIFSSGFYKGEYWKSFMEPGEKILCDDCMWSNPKYITIYGDMRRKDK